MAVDEALIQHITRTIAEQFHPRRIILFGSQARGDAKPDSDIDLFIEMETEHKIKTAAAISLVFGLRNWGMDLIIYTPEQVAQYTGQVGTILYVAETEGKVLYECPNYTPAIPSVARPRRNPRIRRPYAGSR